MKHPSANIQHPEKIQAPGSKPIKHPRTNIQHSKNIQAPGSNRYGDSLTCEVEAWILELPWMLMLGCWRFARL